ncbi:MAG: immunoglobulin domain-containing protein, partial [bacterium]
MTKIDLEDNQLQGSLPPEIGNLIALRQIYLINNQLSGAIPSTLGDLLQLERLYLHENQLTDSIPSALGNLSQLISLQLGDNQLSGTVPKEIFNLTYLTTLSLYENNLFGSIPKEINQLTNLQILSISNNQFDGTIPSEIGELIHLEYIDFFSNQFSGSLPEEMVNLTNLKRLNLFNNQFTDLPDLSSIATLVGLKIENNKFTFEDIEPHINIATFTYAPQDSVGEKQDTLVTTGSTLALSLQVGGEYNQYQWYKNGIPIAEAEDSSHSITSIDMSDSGTYSCEVTNTLAPDLTLYSRPIRVSVELSGIKKDSLALVALYNSTVGDNWTNNANWLTGTVSDWFGITVTDERVKK